MAKYYNNLECPLSIFRDIQLGKGLELLLIDGSFDEVEANDAWLSIYDDYNDAVKSTKNNTTFEKQKQLQVLSNKYSIVKACLFLIVQKLEVNVLNKATELDKEYKPMEYIDEVKILNGFGFRMDINNIEKELIRVNKQKENLKTQISALKKDVDPLGYEYEDKIKKAEGNEELKKQLIEEYEAKKKKQNNNVTIDDTIFSAQKHQGFPFSKDAKVIDLVVCLNDLIRVNASQNKK